MNAVVPLKDSEPKLPVEYTEACTALERCQTLDEARYWDNKADALAAWARIYKHNEAARQARQLKLHAYRRMGQLAEELRPGGNKGGTPLPGPKSLLLENGLSSNEADSARKLSNMDSETYDRILSQPRPPSPTTLRNQRVNGSQAWLMFCGSGTANDNARAFRSFCRRHKPGLLARSLAADEIESAREIAAEVLAWLYEFKRCLPKGNK